MAKDRATLQAEIDALLKDTGGARSITGPLHNTLQSSILDNSLVLGETSEQAVEGPVKMTKLAFDTAAAETASEGEAAWNADAGTLDVGMSGGTIIQLGQEMVLAERPRNKEVVQIDNGQVVYLSGVTAGVPEVMLANAGELDARKTIAVATQDVAADGRGFYTTFGVVRGIDTSGFGAGDTVWLDTTDGQLVNTPPAIPNWVIEVGTVLVSDAANGVLQVHIKNERGEDLSSFFSGTFREGFDALVTSDGATITMSLEQSGGGDLTMQFSDGETTLDCTPAQIIALTAGTISSPQENFIYIPKSTKVLTKSTTAWPATEHIKVAYFFVQTAAYVQVDGCLVNQNWNDPLYHANGSHLVHITERIRRTGALWFSGIAGEGGDDYTTSAAGSVTVQTGAGVVYQMHAQTVPAKDTSGTDDLHVINHDTTPYYQTQNLYDVVNDASGGTLANKYFNIVLIGVANKSGEYSPLLVNLPTGSYNNLSDAQGDVSGYDVFDLPRAFNKESSTAFLIARLTFRSTGGTWVYQSTVDLRGTSPTNVTGGGVGGAITEFSDSLFRIHDNTDATKEIAFEASSITTGNTRTATMPDKDVTLVDDADVTKNDATDLSAKSWFLDEDNMVSDDATKVPSQQSVKAYVDASVVGLLDYKGGYNAATNTPDLDSSPSGILKGDTYTVTADGNFFTEAVHIGDMLIAENDNPTTLAEWTVVEQNLGEATTTTFGYVELATDGETAASKVVQGNDSRLTTEVDPTPDSDHTANGEYFNATAGENLVFGDLVYLKSDGKYWKADADATTTMPGVAIALETINADATGDFLRSGFARDDTWNWTVGGIIYVSTTAGSMTQTAPSGTGDQVQAVGVAYSADVIDFRPSLVLAEVA